jgi:DNA-binding NarL/FixJ family response regulator
MSIYPWLGYPGYCSLVGKKVGSTRDGSHEGCQFRVWPAPMEETVVRILLADDNQLVRRSLRRLLEQHEEWSVCGEATNGREAVTTFQELRPDIVLLDFRMPEMNGLEAAREIAHRAKVPIVLVTMFLNDQLAEEARKAGVQGACPKERIGCVINAVEAMLRRETYFPTTSAA